MKKLRWLVAVLAVLSFAVVAGPASAQTEAIDNLTLKLQKDPGNGDLRSNLVVMIYRQGLEDLRNNFAPDAVTTLENGLEVAQGGPKPMADSSPAVKDMRYALGYALSQQGRYFDAVPVMDDLVASAPESISARYLLGVTLIRSNSNENILRGMEVLAQMAAEGDDDDATIAMHASARLMYNLSTGEYAAGEARIALDMLSDLFAKHGNEPGRGDKENNHLKFATGVYLAGAGDSDGAQFELNSLAGDASGYTLQNGTTLDQVRGNALYQVALDQLGKGGAEGGSSALDTIGKVEFFEDSSVSTMHVKAVAYNLTGDTAAMDQELRGIKSADSSYYDRIVQ
ncbi:MAG: hypothetical protein O7B79_07695 [SAR324 cluster bacterium]|nr:hypothetical protein [SAR324 cluster bacterium]